MYEVNGRFVVVDRDELTAYSKGLAIVHPQSGKAMTDEQLLVVFLPGKALKNASTS
jgi:hypothetical protein